MSESPRTRIRLPHWGWFLLATVALIVTALGLSVWLPYHREQLAIQKIKSWGGETETATFGPAWLRQLVGNGRMHELKVFERVIHVDCHVPVWRANRTRKLKIMIVPMTDADLAHVSRLRYVEHLDLTGREVSDSGLAHLAGLTNLRFLSLQKTTVTDTGLARLRGLPHLTVLFLDRTAVTAKGIEDIKNVLPGCKV